MNSFEKYIALMNAMFEKSLRRNATMATLTRDRICSDPFGIGSTLFTQDWFETRAVWFHIGSPS